jgi:hypothetical protein
MLTMICLLVQLLSVQKRGCKTAKSASWTKRKHLEMHPEAGIADGNLDLQELVLPLLATRTGLFRK